MLYMSGLCSRITNKYIQNITTSHLGTSPFLFLAFFQYGFSEMSNLSIGLRGKKRGQKGKGVAVT